jgi:hypothetical protein
LTLLGPAAAAGKLAVHGSQNRLLSLHACPAVDKLFLQATGTAFLQAAALSFRAQLHNSYPTIVMLFQVLLLPAPSTA